jgi:hypothetical protein
LTLLDAVRYTGALSKGLPMKNALVCLLSLVAPLASASAETKIDYTTETFKYSRFPEQMAGIVHQHEEMLDEYLGTELECRLVRFEMNNLSSPGLFKKGEYSLTLTATCNKKFKDFAIQVETGDSLGEPYWLTLTYVQGGRQVEHKLEVEPAD